VAQDPADIIHQGVAGPLTVTVLSRPKEPVEGRGGPRFSVEVRRTADGSPVADGQVVVSMDRPDGTSAGEIALQRNAALPGVYESRISLPAAGVWEWRVAITTGQGTEFVEGTLNVRPSPSSGWKGTLFALGTIVFLAWRSMRRGQGARL
jgi:hypothetical protein